jgi:hypothetical protein
VMLFLLILTKLLVLVANISSLAASFNYCCFCWVHRDVNSMAHSLAKFASPHSTVFFGNNSNLPPFIYEAWIRDLNSLPINEFTSYLAEREREREEPS